MEEIKAGKENTLKEDKPFLNELNLAYKVNKNDSVIRLFGNNFVENNKNNFKLVVNEKEVPFNDTIQKNSIEENTNIIKVTLKEIKPVSDYSYLFFQCDCLLHFYNADKMNLSHITNISHLFANCKTLISVPDITSWDVSNITKMDSIFFGCHSLLEVPDISKWNIKNATDLNNFFGDCYGLKEIPDISNSDTGNVTNMTGMFVKCSKLEKLPD